MDSAEKQNDGHRAKRKVHYAFARRANKFVKHPAIRIGGQYLEVYGFKTGDEIEVRCEQGRILITKVFPDVPA